MVDTGHSRIKPPDKSEIPVKTHQADSDVIGLKTNIFFMHHAALKYTAIYQGEEECRGTVELTTANEEPLENLKEYVRTTRLIRPESIILVRELERWKDVME